MFDKCFIFKHIILFLNQYLSLTANPIGQAKKILINSRGTHILLVYDKSLSVVTLPLKWGKFDEYEGGKKKIICK